MAKDPSSDGRSEHDAEYLPETVRSPLFKADIDSNVKFKSLMDRIDHLTHSLNLYSEISAEPSGARRRHGPENEDEKDLVSKEKWLYTVKLIQQPASILNGTMRDYQLEGLN